MKTLTQILLAVAATSAFTVGANAAISYGSGSSAGQPYIGVKVGQIDVDGLSKKPTAYGVYGGYNFDHNFGVEGEYVGSESKTYNIGNSRYEYDAKTYGAYGTYRHHFGTAPVYLKGKLGISKTEIDDKGINVNYSHVADKTSLAGGVGVGFKPTSNIGVEAGYNYLNSDASLWGVGAHLSF